MSEPAVTDSAKLERFMTQQKLFNVVVILALIGLAVWQVVARQRSDIEQAGGRIEARAVQAELRALRAQIGKARDLDELRRWMADPDPTAGLRGAESPK